MKPEKRRDCIIGVVIIVCVLIFHIIYTELLLTDLIAIFGLLMFIFGISGDRDKGENDRNEDFYG